MGWVALAFASATLLLPVAFAALWSFTAEYNRGSYLGGGILMSALSLVLLGVLGLSLRRAVSSVRRYPAGVRRWIVTVAAIGTLLIISTI